MKGSLRLMVLTPARTLLDVEGVARVQAQLADGGPIGIYPGHAPLLAETVPAPLRYADRSGEHALDLDAGILQVSDEGVTVLAGGSETAGVSKPLGGSEYDRRFDRLARELLTALDARPDRALDVNDE
jgi:F-type H+-transporting ATPase subunit epsilon